MLLKGLPKLFGENLLMIFGIVASTVLALSLFLSIYFSSNFLNSELVVSSQENNHTLTEVFVNEVYPKISHLLALELETIGDPAKHTSLNAYQRVDESIRNFVRGTHILKAKIFNLKGLTVYASDPADVGKDYSMRMGFKEAMDGRLYSEHSFRETLKTFHGEGQNIDLVSSYVPVKLNNEIVAIVEIYSDRSLSMARSNKVFSALLMTLAPMAVLVFLILLATVGYLDRQRVLQNKKLDEMNLALKEAVDKESRANSAKSEFLAMMSHEIRTPLNGVIATLSMVEKDSLNHENCELIDTALHSSELLTSVINDILDYSKIEANKFTLNQSVINFQELLKQVEKSYRGMVEEKGLEFRLTIGDFRDTYFYADPVRIKQILNNYLNNAFKFTDQGFIEMRAYQREDGKLYFGITDSGIGIDSEGQSHLFKDFTQIDSGTTRSYGGTGLGLVICKKLAQMMNGYVGVESHKGQGSTFWAVIELESRATPDPLCQDSCRLVF